MTEPSTCCFLFSVALWVIVIGGALVFAKYFTDKVDDFIGK